MKKFSHHLKKCMERKGINRLELAELLGLSPPRISQYLNESDLPPNPANTDSHKKLAPRHLSPEAVQQIIEHAGKGARDYLSIMYYTGLRPSDVMRLHTKDIDIKNRVIRAKMGKKRGEPITLPIHSKILPIIKRRASGGFLFPNRAGGHQTSWRTGLKYACERAGIEATAYQFRHSFGTHLLAKTGNIRLVQQLMGHSSITMTTRYATALDEALTEAVEKI